MFTLSKSCHGMMCIQKIDASEKEQEVLLGIIRNKMMTSDDYKMKNTVSPFLQGHDGSFILIEFWIGDKEACEKFVQYCNDKFTAA